MLVLFTCREPTTPDVPPVTTAPAPTASDVPREAGMPERPVTATFVDVPGTASGAICGRVMIAVAKGTVTTLSETLGPGDVLVVTRDVGA